MPFDEKITDKASVKEKIFQARQNYDPEPNNNPI